MVKKAEIFGVFVKRLKKLRHVCELKELSVSLVKDMIIIGTNNLHLQEKLSSETESCNKERTNC